MELLEPPASMSPVGAAPAGAPRRILTFSSLFPSEARPRHGIFVKTRLMHLLRDCAIEARVIAPVPWFPWRAPAFGTYAKFAATPRRAVMESGLQVTYPRYPMLPRIGVALQPDLMARSAWADLHAWREQGWTPDLVDAHYLYPDGVAAAIVAERLGLPLVMTARGTDVNVLARMPGPGRRIRWAAQRAAAVITVSTRLKDALVALGVDGTKIVVLRNGVDGSIFAPEASPAARARLSLVPEGPLAACVGNLVPEKGFDLAVRVLPLLPAWRLVIVGEGPARDGLSTLARQLGVADRVAFLANMPQAELRHVYGAADVLLLTSQREGWPNVVLESLACGTPVVAADVGAVGEMLTDARVGTIVAQREPAAFAAAIEALQQSRPDPALVRRHAEAFDWRTISLGQRQVFVSAMTRRREAAAR